MSSANSAEMTERIADILGVVRRKGVRLWSENGQLHYRAPKGALDPDELARLRASKGQIVALLEKAAGAQVPGPRIEPRARFAPVPLSFSQLAHLNTYLLLEHSAIRQVAFATRLRGRLNIGMFQKGLLHVVSRHDALRTRIVACHGIPMQVVDECGDGEAPLIDLTELANDVREIEVRRQIERLILEPVNIATDPLFVAQLLKLSDDEHVLIVAMEHLISDATSRGILFRDLFTAYTQLLQGRTLALPAIAVQLPDYAAWQSDTHPLWMKQYGEQWNERLTVYPRVRFPEDADLQSPTRLGVGTVSLKIGKDLKDELHTWCRQTCTTPVMSVFSAYAALVLRWCDVPKAVIRYQSDGRSRPEIEGTVGCFSSTLYVPLEYSADATYIDFLGLVTQQYCQAYEHCDFTCMVAAQLPRPEFTRNTCFNWVPASSKFDLDEQDASEHAITCSPVQFVHPMQKNLHPLLKSRPVDHEPTILLYESDDEIAGELYFPLSRFSALSMERFGRNFIGFIEALLRAPHTRVKDIPLR